MRKLTAQIFALLCAANLCAATWQTHFAYSNVEQIAVTSGEVFGLSDGSLYSVNKYTEKLSLWNLSSGLYPAEIDDDNGEYIVMADVVADFDEYDLASEVDNNILFNISTRATNLLIIAH